jgi:hypothetical protein
MGVKCWKWWSLLGPCEVMRGKHARTISRIQSGEHSSGRSRNSEVRREFKCEQWFVAVQEKTLVVQQGMKRVVDSHWLWAVIIDCNCKEVPINSNLRIQNPLLFVTQPIILKILTFTLKNKSSKYPTSPPPETHVLPLVPTMHTRITPTSP